MKHFHRTKPGGASVYRRLALLLLAVIIGGLIEPLLPAQTAAAQRLNQPSSSPSTSPSGQFTMPSAASAPATTVQQAGQTNVARGKKAIQTNVNPFVNDPYPGGGPMRAVDGNTSGDLAAGSLALTWGNNHDPNDWWQVDLGGVYPIDTIDVWNRTDDVADQLHDFYVFVSDTPFVSDDLGEILAQEGVGTFFIAGVAGTTTAVEIFRTGRYVRVVLSEAGALSLAEVQVWSSQSSPNPGTEGLYNVAERKTATQTDVNEFVNDPYPNGEPSRAVDGFLNGDFAAGTSSRTQGNSYDSLDWWQVDLGGIYPIDSIDVWNRTDDEAGLLHDFYVLVSEIPFESNALNANKNQPEVSTYFVEGAAERTTNVAIGRSGRYVRIVLTQPGALSLTEVQVWSTQSKALDAPVNTPTVLAVPGDGTVQLSWLPVRGAVSYRVRRATNSDGPFALIATDLTEQIEIGNSSMLTFTDTGLTNDVPYFYVIRAIGPQGGIRGVSETVVAFPTAPGSYTAFQEIHAANYYALSGVGIVEDDTVGRTVVTSIESGDYVAYSGMDFEAGPHAVSITYAAAQATGATVNFYTTPSEDSLIASVPVTGTGGMDQWSTATAMVAPVQGVQMLYMRFQGKGSELLQLDSFEFLQRGPYDTDTVKWDPNIVLLQQALGITLDTYALDTSDNSMLMTFSASAEEGRQALASVQVGSIIASDTNLDLGGPYARVLELVTMSADQIAVKTQYVPFNQLIVAGGIDLSDAINQSFNDAATSLAGTSALSDEFDPNGYDAVLPNIIYEGDTGGQASRSAGLASVSAQTGDVPTVTAPKEAKGGPSGTFHVTVDNIQFITDEDGFGLEFTNFRLNALGIAPVGSSNPVASQFGFGVLGGIGADTLRAQVLLDLPNAVLSRDRGIDMGAKVSVKAHFQMKGLAVGMWFFEIPAKWIKPIRFPVPTPIGPLPSSLVFGIQGYAILVGVGNFTAEFGVQGALQTTSDLSKLIQISSYGDTKLDIGQKVQNTSLIGFAVEPYAKVRVGDFTFASDVLSWLAFSLGLGFDQERLKKLEGLVVFTFTPRMQALNILNNWKDKDSPIFEQKACAQPVIKMEALPGFPKKMTFELRTEIPVYLCPVHTGWLYYDMKVEDSYQVDPATGEATVDWSMPIISERSTVPHTIYWNGPVPYQIEENPVVESRDIADSFPLLNAAERRTCVIYRRPFISNGVRYPVKIEYSGPCQENAVSRIQLSESFSSAPYALRVMTEYRLDNPLNSGSTNDLAQQIDCDINNMAICGTFGVWSEKNFRINSAIDDTAFAINGTLIYTDSAIELDAFEGTECDPDAKKAIGMQLMAAITPKPAGSWQVQGGRLLVDGVEIASSMSNGSQTDEKLFTATQPQDLAAGAHTLKLVATLYNPNVTIPGTTPGDTRTATYYATFKVKPKTCGRAKSDEFAGIIFEGSRCARQDTPFSPLDVLGNDDLSGGGTWEISAVSGARLGEVKISDDKQQLLYKPGAVGVDTFTYELSYGLPSIEISTGAVLVNNRIASSDADCAGGGGGSGGNPGKKGRLTSWGDPHITTADGKKFDSHAFGEFVYYQPKAGKSGFTLQGRQEPWEGNGAAAVMSVLAFKINGHSVEFRSRESQKVLVDGQAPTSSAIDLGNNASMTTSPTYSQIDLPNVHIEVKVVGDYLNLTIDLPLDNTYEGMFGSPNDDKNDDWLLPSGGTAANMSELADAWRITDRALSLFTYDAGEGPETYNKPNVRLGELPDDATLAPLKQQARSLLTTTCDTGSATADEDQVEALALDLYLGAQPEEIAAQLCTYEVSGTITSTNPSGAPVVGASVQLVSDQTELCVVYTNRDGVYSCTLAPRPGADVPSVQIKVNGVVAQTFSFASKAPVNGRLSEVHDLVVTRPSVRLTVRSLDADGNPAPNTTVQVNTIGVTRQVTTGDDGTKTVVFTYAPGTTNAWFNATPVAPAYGYRVDRNATLDQNGPVEFTIETKHILLDTPTWVRSATGTNSSNTFTPMVTNSGAAIAVDGTIYTIGYQYNRNGRSQRLVATNPDGTPKWVSEGFGIVSSYAAPVVGGDGSIYLLAREYPVVKLYAFNPDGSQKWSFATPDNYTYTSPQPAVGANGAVYFVAAQYNQSTSTFYGIDQTSGEAVWTYSLAEQFGSYTPSTPVLGPNGALYFVGSRLWGFYPNGTIKRSTFTTLPDAQMAIAPNGVLYLSTGNEYEGHSAQTWAVNPNLTLRWSQYVGAFYAPVLAPDGSIYIGDYEGLRKLDPATGATVWSLSENVQSAPVVGAEGMIHVMVTPPYASGVPSGGQVVAVGADGTVVSRFITRSSGTTALKMAADGTLYATISNPVSSSGQDLYAIPSGSSGPASGWSSAWGNPQNTNR